MVPNKNEVQVIAASSGYSAIPVDRHDAPASITRRLRRLWLRSEALRGYLLLSPTLLVMVSLLALPLAMLLVLSFWTQDGITFDRTFTLDNYREFFAYSDSPLYIKLLIRSVAMSAVSTGVILLMSYPIAYYLAFRVRQHKVVWIILITVPFWISYLLRIFAWKVILGFDGLINSSLISLHLIDKPLEFLLYNPVAVTITLSHAWAAYAILPIYVSLEKIDRSLLEAATDLGDSKLKRFLRITLPLSMPGTIASLLLVFIPTVGDYVTPTLVGGTSGMMIGNVIQTLVTTSDNMPMGAAASVIMMFFVTMLICGLLLVVGKRHRQVKEL
ncbi:spermidine/putrescine transport system permease protein [Mesorhizobium sp. YL-MeA3-2017]|jgi:spermidine/putrescine transport system permease protein|uniref:ABC transporter permease n=1 Tax=Mesorhizobium TaxID=68287 RepID=UPI0009F1D6B5|nr:MULTISPECIES: ABC transporter permease [Mesorhizobium]MBN9235896.1 ABC transporter permease [Mesorhizobium sp.]MDQ0333005.1 spermidine/putrescine transport system permease protein [Mesorhizobium sp. YL-MeA3-2017]